MPYSHYSYHWISCSCPPSHYSYHHYLPLLIPFLYTLLLLLPLPLFILAWTSCMDTFQTVWPMPRLLCGFRGCWNYCYGGYRPTLAGSQMVYRVNPQKKAFPPKPRLAGFHKKYLSLQHEKAGTGRWGNSERACKGWRGNLTRVCLHGEVRSTLADASCQLLPPHRDDKHLFCCLTWPGWLG